MSDKLLRAFIKASGFEIETITEEFNESGGDGSRTWSRCGIRAIDYKVTKKVDDFMHCDKDAEIFKNADDAFKENAEEALSEAVSGMVKVTKKECEAIRLLKLVMIGDDEYDWSLDGDLSNEIKEFLDENN